MDSNAVRRAFLSFFEEKEHAIVPSSSMVVRDDPTLMFTNAGMNQFKDIFLGNASSSHARVADSQKCLRVSGKQNDLEEVGHDTYHHTMFEMLGNWSFGDYFKPEAIAWAWEFLVHRLGLSPDRLYVTIFEGDSTLGLPQDQEAASEWARWIAPERILLGSTRDNFWEMGDTGPCGPCSEIHIDLRTDAERDQQDGASLVNQDHPHVIEIWNLVFMQYNRLADGSLQPLPARHVDTGMGLERLCMVLQGKDSTYDTDLFQRLINYYAQAGGVEYGASEPTDIALRVVADHLRAVSFAIADGQLPSNTRGGYVIRRILRRAVRYGYSFLGFRTPFLHKGFPTLCDLMGQSYPELVTQRALIVRVIEEEERAFFKTLSSGVGLLHKLVERARQKGEDKIAGEEAFTLFDTYGFPLDLTELMAREAGLSVDVEGFTVCMTAQRNRSRKASQVNTGDWQEVHAGEAPHFVGYDTLTSEVQIRRMREVKTPDGMRYEIVIDPVPFYAEAGGQVGDRGELVSVHERVRVLDTVKEHQMTLLVVDHLPSHPEAQFEACVDASFREGVMQHHTGTHLLHYALREVLGSHVEQRGSLVENDRLRFDFSHFERMTPDQIRQVEQRVNALIRASLPREEHRNLPLEEAQKMGAIALFGEKYGSHVRVLKYGNSVEFCGGTHVENTGSLGMLKIVSEGAIASGVRRVEAVVGERAEALLYQLYDERELINRSLQAQGQVLEAVQRLQTDKEQLQSELNALQTTLLQQEARTLLQEAVTTSLEGVFLVESIVSARAGNALKQLASHLGSLQNNLVVVLGCVADSNKPTLAVSISDAVVSRYKLHAGKAVREAAKAMKGGGGGQAGFAMAGGKDSAGLPSAVVKAISFLGLRSES